MTILVCLQLLPCLLGCKAKDWILSGQVFVVTQGSANIELGDVEVLLLEKKAVVDFLELVRSALEEDLRDKAAHYAAAQLSLSNATAAGAVVGDANQHLEAESADVNSLIQRLESEIKEANQTLQKNARSVRQVQSIYADSQHIYEQMKRQRSSAHALNQVATDVQTQLAIKTQAEALAWSFAARAVPLINGNKEQLEDLRERARELDSTLSAERASAESIIAEARAQLWTASNMLHAPVFVENVLADFNPKVVRSARTGSKGEFRLPIPHKGKFTIFARAERTVFGTGEPTREEYLWLFDAPAKPPINSFILSNSRLAENDPDGYFNTWLQKPVEVRPNAARTNAK